MYTNALPLARPAETLVPDSKSMDSFRSLVFI